MASSQKNSKKRKVTVGLIQMSMVADKKKNREKAVAMIKDAARKGAQIVCLPELFNTLYFPQDEHQEKKAHNLAEPIPGETTTIMTHIAKELGIILIVPLYEKGNDGKYYNTAVVIDENGRIIDTYRKMHIPHDPLFWEKNYFERGNFGFKVVKTSYAVVAPMICFDQWFPEAARINVLQGAEILFYPTAIGYIRGYKAKEDWHEAWETIQRSHAIANGTPVVSVNRVGIERKMQFWGQSFIGDAFGKVLKRASKQKEEVIVQEIDLSYNHVIQGGWGFLRNRRQDSYGVLVK